MESVPVALGFNTELWMLVLASLHAVCVVACSYVKACQTQDTEKTSDDTRSDLL